MKKIFLSLIAFMMLAVSFQVLAAPPADPSGPVGLLQSIADRLIDRLKQNKANLQNNPSLVYRLARELVVPHADLPEMSRRVLPAATWNNATAGQRLKFQKEFTTLLVRTYASALADYSGQTVQFYPVRGGYEGKSSVRVNSKIIRSDGPAISMNYSLLRTPSGWKLYDMTVEGVSLLESFRSQFSGRLSAGNLNELNAELERHNN